MEIGKTNTMRQVSLFTISGHFVIKIAVLPFNPMPEILLLGERHFIRETDERYLEGICFVVPPPVD